MKRPRMRWLLFVLSTLAAAVCGWAIAHHGAGASSAAEANEAAVPALPMELFGNMGKEVKSFPARN